MRELQQYQPILSAPHQKESHNLCLLAIKKSAFGISGLGLETRSFAIVPSGIRTNIEIAITIAVFLPVQPPKTNRSIITIGQNTSRPYLEDQIIKLLNRWLCELLMYKDAVESALVIGE